MRHQRTAPGPAASIACILKDSLAGHQFVSARPITSVGTKVCGVRRFSTEDAAWWVSYARLGWQRRCWISPVSSGSTRSRVRRDSHRDDCSLA